MTISLAAINVPPEAKENVNRCMAEEAIGQSHWVEDFERALAAFVGAKHAIATSSGTMADAVALLAARDGFEANRVVCPALTFIAQPNAARYAGLDVDFFDVGESFTLQWPGFSERILYPSDCLGRISPVANVEDACEAFGSRWNGKMAGTFGTLGTYSFFVSHTISTGEGGAIVTDDDELAALCRQIRSHGRASETDPALKFTFPLFGFNAKMSGLTAAFGLGVLAHAQEYIERRHSNYLLMNSLIGGFDERPGEYLVPHAFPVAFESEQRRDEAMWWLKGANIECRKFFSCIPTMEGAYAAWKDTGPYPVAEHIARTHLYVPVHQNLTTEEVHYVANAVNLLKGGYPLESSDNGRDGFRWLPSVKVS